VGSFDTVHDGDRYEQVKLWGKGLRYLHIGDRVGLPRGGLGPTGTYSVAMRTGGYVHVLDGVLAGWHETPGDGPRLNTGGGRFDEADWPGGPFGPWYRDADAPPDRRLSADLEHGCPRHGAPPLRMVRDDDPGSLGDVALAAARADVTARLEAGLDEDGRMEAAREYLADRKGSVHVACAASAALLGVDDDADRAGARLVTLLSSAAPDAPEWSNAARLLARTAAVLPAAQVADCLRLLAGALPADVLPAAEPGPDPGPAPVEADEHPALRRRRRRVALDGDDFLEWLSRYAEPDFQAAAEAAVARHGAAVLPAVPLTFWARDIAATELVIPLLTPVLGRGLTAAEEWVLDEVLRQMPGTLDTLDAAALTAALRRALAR
jgi:hypothetical protein